MHAPELKERHVFGAHPHAQRQLARAHVTLHGHDVARAMGAVPVRPVLGDVVDGRHEQERLFQVAAVGGWRCTNVVQAWVERKGMVECVLGKLTQAARASNRIRDSRASDGQAASLAFEVHCLLSLMVTHITGHRHNMFADSIGL